MKTLLVIFLGAFVVTASANPGLPPEPQGDKTRFQIVSGMIDHGGGPVSTFMRLDTHTGQTWLLQQVPLARGNGALLPVWVPSHEIGSDLYKAAVQTMATQAK